MTENYTSTVSKPGQTFMLRTMKTTVNQQEVVYWDGTDRRCIDYVFDGVSISGSVEGNSNPDLTGEFIVTVKDPSGKSLFILGGVRFSADSTPANLYGHADSYSRPDGVVLT